ncbi:flavin-containing monooxygenase, partial [Methylobacterium soli]|uniref:flavin-containing monooxygenase n=1 Tax=Methylobacterium soli TaxID=553447 RepID=UPI0035A22BF0
MAQAGTSLSAYDVDQEVRHFDVLVVGAGISGISAGYYLQARCPGRSFAILDSRDAIGGTWDLFRYPGVRSDSDLYTFGYSFRPWRGDKSIADGPSILSYIRDTAEAYGIDRRIKFGHCVTQASWSSADALWNLDVEVGADRLPTRYACQFLYLCTGYFDYDAGYMPTWPDMDQFRGPIIHPQLWPDDADYENRRVIVIGSGATAVTLVPELAKAAAHVTLLQRSPTYIVTIPGEDAIAKWLRRHLPDKLAHGLSRWKNVFLGLLLYTLARRLPNFMTKAMLRAAQKQLGPDFDVNRHLRPRYKPWDQRLCLAPDGDLFRAIRSGQVTLVTGEIESFTPAGLRLRSGEQLEADVIVSATGLQLRLMGGMRLEVDGTPLDPSKELTYKGMMFSNIPNLAGAIGYTNASWTLKCELTSRYVCRLLNHMQEQGYSWCVPRRRDPAVLEEPAVTLTSGYIQRALASLPKQGSKRPWRLHKNYLLDLVALRFGSLADGTLEFG